MKNKTKSYYLLVEKIERDTLVPYTWDATHLKHKRNIYKIRKVVYSTIAVEHYKEFLQCCPDKYKLFKVGSIQEVKIKRNVGNNDFDYGFLI